MQTSAASTLTEETPALLLMRVNMLTSSFCPSIDVNGCESLEAAFGCLRESGECGIDTRKRVKRVDPAAMDTCVKCVDAFAFAF
jgi:hypothetical protein